jgi:hypothetical protein
MQDSNVATTAITVIFHPETFFQIKAFGIIFESSVIDYDQLTQDR